MKLLPQAVREKTSNEPPRKIVLGPMTFTFPLHGWKHAEPIDFLRAGKCKIILARVFVFMVRPPH